MLQLDAFHRAAFARNEMTQADISSLTVEPFKVMHGQSSKTSLVVLKEVNDEMSRALASIWLLSPPLNAQPSVTPAKDCEQVASMSDAVLNRVASTDRVSDKVNGLNPKMNTCFRLPTTPTAQR